MAEVTSVTVLLDESGSMQPHVEQTILGLNQYINSLRESDSDFRVSVFKFSGNGNFSVTTSNNIYSKDSKLESTFKLGKVFENKTLNKVPTVTVKDYNPCGGTPLLDAVWEAIKRAEKNAGDNNLVVIFTDGEENASSLMSGAVLKDIIAHKESLGWTFVYLGANQDAWQVANSFGIQTKNAMTYNLSRIGATMDAVGFATRSYAAAPAAASAQGFFAAAGQTKEDYN